MFVAILNKTLQMLVNSHRSGSENTLRDRPSITPSAKPRKFLVPYRDFLGKMVNKPNRNQHPSAYE